MRDLPLVENAVRVAAHCRLGPFGLARVRHHLVRACADVDHDFWADDISLRESERVDFDRMRGHDQITDLYLLA